MLHEAFAAQAKLGCSSQLIINEAEVAVQQSANGRNTNLRGDHPFPTRCFLLYCQCPTGGLLISFYLHW